MNSVLNEHKTILSVFLRLNMPPDKFKIVFETSPISFLLGPVSTTEIAPNVPIGPPKFTLGEFEGTILDYNPERYIISIRGPFRNAKLVLEILKGSFQKIDYDLDKITRFFEFQINDFHIFEKNFKETFQKMIEIKGLDRITELTNLNFQPWDISFVSPNTPMSDQWFNISIRSDIFSPDSNAYLRIIKRTENYNQMMNYIENIPNLLDEIIMLYIRGQ